MNRRPTLSPRQDRFVARGAAMLPVGRQEDFVRRVHVRLAGEPCDSAVCHAVNMALDVMARHEG